MVHRSSVTFWNSTAQESAPGQRLGAQRDWSPGHPGADVRVLQGLPVVRRLQVHNSGQTGQFSDRERAQQPGIGAEQEIAWR